MASSVYLKIAKRKLETSTGAGAGFEWAVTNCQGWRNTQEDVHLTLPYFEPDTSLFAVFDGHSGIEVAEYVSRYLPAYISRNRKYRSGDIVEGLKEAFLLLDNSIITDEAREELTEIRRANHPELPANLPGITSGTTAVVCLIKEGAFYVANVGDSRCVLARAGVVMPLSEDTKPESAEETARIERAGGVVCRGRINSQINVSRAFGDHLYKLNPTLKITEQMIIPLPEVVVMPRSPNDQFLVLMCDGIWNTLTNEEVVAFVAKRMTKGAKLGKITEAVIKQVLPEKMPPSGIKGKDNMTFMIVRLKA